MIQIWFECCIDLDSVADARFLIEKLNEKGVPACDGSDYGGPEVVHIPLDIFDIGGK